MGTNDVTLGQVIASLREEGLQIAPYQVHYLLQAGRITRPRKDAAGNYRFTSGIVDEVRQTLARRHSKENLKNEED